MVTQEQYLEIIKQHAARLAEHFDTVQIICTRHDEHKGSQAHQWGAGNLFGRLGSVTNWLDNFEETFFVDDEEVEDDGD